MWPSILNRFRSYRHEGIETHEALPALANSNTDLPPYDHPYELPRSRKGVINIYGNCGIARLDPKWERANLVLIKDLPGTWNGGKGRMYCHYKAAPALREALHRCEIYGVLGYIEKIGCFNWRPKRTGPELSYHSWGIAFDINPADNKLRRYKRALTPAPHSPAWWDVWPAGVPEKLVKAFKESGFAWGGDWRTTPDPMHFELVSA